MNKIVSKKDIIKNSKRNIKSHTIKKDLVIKENSDIKILPPPLIKKNTELVKKIKVL